MKLSKSEKELIFVSLESTETQIKEIEERLANLKKTISSIGLPLITNEII